MIQDFIDFLENEQILRKLKELYGESKYIKEENLFLNRILKNFKKDIVKRSNKDIKVSKDSFIYDLDIFSRLYEQSLDHEVKKRTGEFYTPISVVDYILKAVGYTYLNNIENKQIIDISCGAGSFVIQLIKVLIKRYLQRYKRGSISDLTTEEAKTIISSVKENIFGLDINRIACILCQINIYYVLYDVIKIIKNSDITYSVPQFKIKNCDALAFHHQSRYDFVVGNPPYLFLRDIPLEQRDIIEEENYETNDGQYDLYQIFLELGIKLLKEYGFLGYIIPDSLLVLSNRKIIRKYIYNTTKIREIYHTGPKFNDPVVSNIIIILEKENNNLERKSNQIIFKTSEDEKHLISQELIQKWNYKFLINLSSEDISILDYLHNNFSKLKDLKKEYNIKLLLRRGVELSKTGSVIYCENCSKYSPLPKKNLICRYCSGMLSNKNIERIIYDKIPPDMLKSDFKLFLYAMNRYKNEQYRYIDIVKPGINYKDMRIYENRIIIRQLSQNNKICASYDKNLSLTSQSFYNLKIERSPFPEFNHFYLLGLINSLLFSYYFIKSFGTYKKLFPRLLLEKIKDFPIKVPISKNEKEKAKKIIEYVKLILEDINNLEDLQARINSLIFDLYQISNSNQDNIVDSMNHLSS